MYFSLWYNWGQSCAVNTSPYCQKIQEGFETMRLSEASHILTSWLKCLQQSMTWTDLSDCSEMVEVNHFDITEKDQEQKRN